MEIDGAGFSSGDWGYLFLTLAGELFHCRLQRFSSGDWGYLFLTNTNENDEPTGVVFQFR